MTTRSVEIELPIGFSDRSGRLHRAAALRSMTGREEELLYDSQLNPGQLVTALLTACLLRIGSLESVDKKLVTALYLADRNTLLLELRRLSLGDKLTAVYRCPSCDAECRVVEDLSQIRVQRLPPDQGVPKDIVVHLEDGHQDHDGTIHREVTLTLPRGTDEELVSLGVQRDPLRARDALVLRCIAAFGSLPNSVLSTRGVELLRNLTLRDRQLLFQAFNSDLPGPDFRRLVLCDQCGSSFQTVLDAANFFALG